MEEVYEASTLLAYAKDRVQAYKAFDEQLDALKKALHAVATLDHEFHGKVPNSIKGLYITSRYSHPLEKPCIFTSILF